MKRTSAAVVVAMVAGLAPYAIAAADQTAISSVMSLRVVTDAHEAQGTAVLVGAENTPTATLLYYLTSSRLFSPPDGHEASPTLAQLSADGVTLDVGREDIRIARGGIVDVAILRTTAPPDTAVRPKSLSYASPELESVFVIAVPDGSGGTRTVPQRARFVSTLFVVGDRDISDVSGCVGAPAIAPDGVFGVVRECEPHRGPVVSLLSVGHSLLERQLPPRRMTAMEPEFSVVERAVPLPPLTLPCETADVTVPLRMAPGEVVAEVTPTMVQPREVRLADVTVVNFEERSVRLRFSFGTDPQPAAPSVGCPPGQALITLHVRAVVTPR